MFLGEPSLSFSPPRVPVELESPHWSAGRRYDDLRRDYTHVIEQSVDLSHLPFVHKRTIGRKIRPTDWAERDVQLRPAGFSISFTKTVPRWLGSLHHLMNQYSATEALSDGVPPPGIHFDMPNLFRVVQGGMVMGLYAVPIEPGKTRVYQFAARRWLANVPLLSSLITTFTMMVNRLIVAEDRRILETQLPDAIPHDAGDEILVRSDRAEILYRQLLKQYDQRSPRQSESKPCMTTSLESRVPESTLID